MIRTEFYIEGPWARSTNVKEYNQPEGPESLIRAPHKDSPIALTVHQICGVGRAAFPHDALQVKPL